MEKAFLKQHYMAAWKVLSEPKTLNPFIIICQLLK